MIKRFTQIFLGSLLLCCHAHAQFKQAASESDQKEYALDEEYNEMAEEAEELQRESATGIRRFHEVLDELLAEFGYDVKTGQIAGLKNLAIRKVEVSDAIPSTYKKYMELLISERIRENSKIRIISCIPCQSKTSRLIDGKIVITSPTTNVGELKTTAERLGVDNFMDIVLVYHSTHMVLAFQIFKPDTNELIWSRSYNSETIRSRFQKLAIDYSQVEKSRPGEDYQPEYRILAGFGGGGLPNVAGDKRDQSMLSLHLRSTEKFNNRKTEFGMLFSAYMTLASIISEYPKEEGTGTDTPTTDSQNSNQSDVIEPAQPVPFTFALGIFGIYAQNFLGSLESYNKIRQGLHAAIGIFLTSGYLAPTIKVGWDVYFGRNFAVSLSGVLISESNIQLDNQTRATKGGFGGELVLSYNF